VHLVSWGIDYTFFTSAGDVSLFKRALFLDKDQFAEPEIFPVSAVTLNYVDGWNCNSPVVNTFNIGVIDRFARHG
jgi:hypothetical protein